jgi:hypothetical protein
MRLDPESTVRAGRDAYLDDNGFDMSGYTSKTFGLPFLGREIHLPNPPTRQRVIARHDLHHALTGYGTDYIGEAEIGVWELRAGCNTVFLWAINLTAIALGIFLSPRRIWRAWQAAAGQRSLYVDERDLEELLALKLGDLRAQRGVPREGLVGGPVGKAAFARSAEA